MTLRVPIEQFAETVRRVLRVEEAYLSHDAGGMTTVTAFHPDKRVRVMAKVAQPEEQVCEKLNATRLRVHKGLWLDMDDKEPDATPGAPYVVAVAYATGDPQPGVWVDAFQHQPTPTQALRAIYDDFRETGELGDVSFEEFVRLSNPTIVIVSPTELRSYADSKAE